ncbi:hypothetical protein [Nereida sp. NH-UV-3]|uniref:hypothetical protein n=1 Tax=Nereida TaxID=282198 RepID=UPI0036F225FD
MRTTLIAALALAPTALFAAGSSSSTPPKATKTTTECETGMVYDADKQSCVEIKKSALGNDAMFDAARELAYAGRHQDAQQMLNLMQMPNDDRVLTYLGFTHRKMGDASTGLAYYQKALAVNPDNLLARSYMGQGYVESGDIELASAQLTEIRTRGGRGTWAEISLRMALQNGQGYSY